MTGAVLRISNPVNLIGTIPAGGGTLDLDTLVLSSFRSNKYIIQFFNTAEAKFKQLEMATSKKSGDVSDQVHSKVGDILGVEAKFLVSGTDVVLRLTNNEAFIVSVSALRFNL